MNTRESFLILFCVGLAFLAGFGIGWYQVAKYQMESLGAYRNLTCGIVYRLNSFAKKPEVVEEEKGRRRR